MLSNRQDAGDRVRMRQMSPCSHGAYILEGRDLGWDEQVNREMDKILEGALKN